MISIGISGINTTDNPGPGSAVARSLKQSEMDCRLIGLSYDVYDPGHYIPGLYDETFTLPWPAGGWDPIRQRLESIRQECGLDLVIPCLDAELPLYIHHRQQLADMGISLLLPDEEQFGLRDKERLATLGPDMGIVSPRTLACRNVTEVQLALELVGLPAMIKGPYYKAKKVYSHAEALEAFAVLAEEWGFPVLVQQRVQGEEINLVGLGDGTGQMVGHVSARKTTVTELGKIWSGVTIHHPQLVDAARRFVRHTRWRGPFELECIAGRDEIFLIEINPRFPAWCWFATAVGVNLPVALVQLARGEEVAPLPDFPAGKFFMRFTEELVCDLDRFRRLVTKGASHEHCH